MTVTSTCCTRPCFGRILSASCLSPGAVLQKRRIMRSPEGSSAAPALLHLPPHGQRRQPAVVTIPRAVAPPRGTDKKPAVFIYETTTQQHNSILIVHLQMISVHEIKHASVVVLPANAAKS
mmetsp:Transcript_113377/g.201064  ORF Transcript_113377/g.201064 Transcript_113377/m.201064 type:complete len:121 (+) Transcript_113377:954-1316(+)